MHVQILLLLLAGVTITEANANMLNWGNKYRSGWDKAEVVDNQFHKMLELHLRMKPLLLLQIQLSIYQVIHYFRAFVSEETWGFSSVISEIILVIFHRKK